MHGLYGTGLQQLSREECLRLVGQVPLGRIVYSRAVTDGADIRHLEEAGLVRWAPGERDHFIRIRPEIVNGRRVTAWGQLAGNGHASSI